jgi:hypothetical protein
MSNDFGSNPNRPRRPRTRSDVPGSSRCSSHGWLKNVTSIEPLSSSIRAVRI